MTKFKIGDRVRYTGKDSRYNDKQYIGCTGTVQSLIDDGVGVLWDKTNKEDPGLGEKFPENLELIPTTFEIGKTYKILASVPLKCIYQEGEYFTFIGNRPGIDRTLFAVMHHSIRFKDSVELKPEDWRCLHYENNIASLGGESFSSKEEVEKKFSSSPNFIKAVRVDV